MWAPLRKLFATRLVSQGGYGPRVYLSGPAYMLSFIRPEVRLPFDQRILYRDCCKKMHCV